MKKLKIMSAILAVIMTFGLCACGKDGGITPSDNPTTSATTVAPTDTATTTAAAAANEFITTGKSIKITIPKLENTEMHSTVMLSAVDKNIIGKLGIRLSCDPKRR